MGKRVYLKDPAGPAIWDSSPQAATTFPFLPAPSPAAPSSPLAWVAVPGFGGGRRLPGPGLGSPSPASSARQPLAVRAFIQRWSGPGWFVVIF